MIDLTTKENFEAIINEELAAPTSRCMPDPQKDIEEWEALGMIGDKKVCITYHFDKDVWENEDADNYPWDFAHVVEIEEVD